MRIKWVVWFVFQGVISERTNSNVYGSDSSGGFGGYMDNRMGLSGNRCIRRPPIDSSAIAKSGAASLVGLILSYSCTMRTK